MNSSLNETSATTTSLETGVITAVLSVMIVMALLGNLLVIGAFYFAASLREVANYFIVSLAVADILVSLFSMPMWIAYVNNDFDSTTFGEPVFRLWVCVDILTGMASITSLIFITIVRYVHILRPYFFDRKVTSKVGLAAIFLVWFIALSLAGLRLLMWFSTKPQYEVVIFICGLFVPIVILVFCYVRIFSVVKRHIVAIVDNSKPKAATVRLMREFRAAKSIAIVILAFAFCWCPFLVLNMFYGICEHCNLPDWLVILTKLLHYGNSTLNPIIYAVFHKQFAKVFGLILRRMKSRLLSHDGTNDRRGSFPLTSISQSSGLQLSRARINSKQGMELLACNMK